MTPTEFESWIAYHKTLHPDFAHWANCQSDATKRELSGLWKFMLSEVDMEAAKQVSRDLLTGDVEQPPAWQYARDYNLLARIVVQATSKPEPLKFRLSSSDNMTGRPETFRCHHCRDTGQRLVYTRPSAIAVWLHQQGREGIDPDDPAQARRLRTCVVLCDCSAGGAIMEVQGLTEDQPRNHRHGKVWRASQVYDADRHCDCPRGDRVEHAAELAEWVRRVTDVRNRPNYTNEFDDWNREGGW